VNRERPSREQLILLAKTDPEAIADLVLMLWDRVEALEAKVAQLERNSRSSSKPPSTDKGNFTNPPKPKSLRTKSGRKPGGQKGHRGDTLQQSESPDHIVEHRIDEDESGSARCPKCGTELAPGHAGPLERQQCECRQVFELPAIRIEVTEHRAEKRVCGQCAAVVSAAFPPSVVAPVQYGPGVRATALYLGSYQLVPYRRLSEIFSEMFGCPLSEGTLANFITRGGHAAASAMGPIREALAKGDLAHADETGCTVNGKRHWLHVFSTAALTCYHVDAKRGGEAMLRMGLLERFRGALIRDCLAAYNLFRACRHFYCNAHLQRELVYVHEQMGQKWAAEMIALLLEAKSLRDRENARRPERRRVIGAATRERIQTRYCDIVTTGLKVNPEPPPPPPGKKKPGRIKRSKSLNLLIRLDTSYVQIMGFFEFENVPYDNNQAERDLRMMKVREKISGTFRSADHAQAFCDIRSIISCARKQSRGMLATLAALSESPSSIGTELANGICT
jgi:transposase